MTFLRRLKAILLLPLGCLVVAALLAEHADAEPTANSRIQPSALFDIQSYVDKALAEGASKITLPQGRHRVAPTRGVHLRLHGIHDVTIVAEGVEMVCTETTRAIEIEDCLGLTLSGLAIDYDPLPFTQGRIVKLSPDKRTHEIEILDGYPEAQTATTKKYQIYRNDDLTLRWVDYFNPKVESLSKTRLRVTKTQQASMPPEEIGDWVVIGSSSGAARELPHAVTLVSCSGVKLDRVTVYASNCFAFLENDCDRTVYNSCRVAKRGFDSDLASRPLPRLRSANADAFHSKRATRGPQIIGCYAHYQGDDCVNINGDYHLVSHSAGKRLRVIAKQSMDIQGNDTVELTGSPDRYDSGSRQHDPVAIG